MTTILYKPARMDTAAIKSIIPIITVIWILFSVVAIHSFWPEIKLLHLSDNDDYMRYAQFTQWIKNGNWHIGAMPQFNPSDGYIIHWSRVPDFLLAASTVVLSPILGFELSSYVAITIVPLIYLWFTLMALGIFCLRLLGRQYTIFAVIFFITSFPILKFVPGSIDHHNIQIMFAAIFLALMPFEKYEAKNNSNAVLQGIIIAFSFWVGLENIFFYFILMTAIVIRGQWESVRYFHYAKLVCLSALLFSTLFLVVHRPVSDLFTPYIDSISWLYLFDIAISLIFCELSIRYFKHKHRWLRLFTLASLAVILIYLVTPEVLFGVYHNYPELLNKYWLSSVGEAVSILDYVQIEGFLSNHNALIYFIPAMLSVLFIRKSKKLIVLYIIFIALLSIPIFWQFRTITLVCLPLVVLQSLFAVKLMERVPSYFLKLATVSLCIPIVIPTILRYEAPNDKVVTQEAQPSSRSDVIVLLENNAIENSKVLTPMRYGAQIIAETNNAVIAAPYHRNINGNSLMITIFTSQDEDEAYKLINRNKLKYVIVGSDPSTDVLLTYSTKSALIHQLKDEKSLDWLKLIDKSQSGILLYEVLQQ